MIVLEGERDGPNDAVIEIELTVQNPDYPFVGVSEEENCRVELARMIPRSDADYAEFFNVFGASSDHVQAHADSYEGIETTLLSEYDDGGLFEFSVSGNCPAYSLAELGALPRTVEGVDGQGRIVAEIPSTYTPSTVTDPFFEEYPEFDLRAKRAKDSHTSMLTPSTFRQSLRNELTERQEEVLQTAFEMGYYEWPRNCTGQDVADELGIASATFSEHIFAAERKLLEFMFRDLSRSSRPDTGDPE
jgi:predicted DNA binding protein